MDIGLGIEGQIVRIGEAFAAQGVGVFCDRDKFKNIAGIGGEILGKRRFDLLPGGRGGDLDNNFIAVVNQVDSFTVRLEGVHILQLPAKQFIEEKQVEIFGMEVQVEEIQLAAQLDFCSKSRELADDVVEIARPVHYMLSDR